MKSSRVILPKKVSIAEPALLLAAAFILEPLGQMKIAYASSLIWDSLALPPNAL
jgi:hypothetical protein